MLLAIVALVGCTQPYAGAGNSTDTTTPPTGGDSTAKIVELDMTDSSMPSISISQGDTVKFVNTGTVGHWPASAMHPTHTVYPGSGIEKCGTSEQPGIFDSCGDIVPGDSWSFTFDDKGAWGYHDHSNSKLFGKITVE